MPGHMPRKIPAAPRSRIGAFPKRDTPSPFLPRQIEHPRSVFRCHRLFDVTSRPLAPLVLYPPAHPQRPTFVQRASGDVRSIRDGSGPSPQWGRIGHGEKKWPRRSGLRVRLLSGSASAPNMPTPRMVRAVDATSFCFQRPRLSHPSIYAEHHL